jgi:hypothetical protein
LASLGVREPVVEAAEALGDRLLRGLVGLGRAVAEVLEIALVQHGPVVRDGLAALEFAELVERVVRSAAVRGPELLADLVELLHVALVEREVRLQLQIAEALRVASEEQVEVLRFERHGFRLREQRGLMRDAEAADPRNSWATAYCVAARIAMACAGFAGAPCPAVRRTTL